MVLLTCDFDINPALMSSLASGPCVQQQQRSGAAAATARWRCSAQDSASEPITYELSQLLVRDVTAART